MADLTTDDILYLQMILEPTKTHATIDSHVIKKEHIDTIAQRLPARRSKRIITKPLPAKVVKHRRPTPRATRKLLSTSERRNPPKLRAMSGVLREYCRHHIVNDDVPMKQLGCNFNEFYNHIEELLAPTPYVVTDYGKTWIFNLRDKNYDFAWDNIVPRKFSK